MPYRMIRRDRLPGWFCATVCLLGFVTALAVFPGAVLVVGQGRMDVWPSGLDAIMVALLAAAVSGFTYYKLRWRLVRGGGKHSPDS
jgi:hypothetical protein